MSGDRQGRGRKETNRVLELLHFVLPLLGGGEVLQAEEERESTRLERRGKGEKDEP